MKHYTKQFYFVFTSIGSQDIKDFVKAHKLELITKIARNNPVKLSNKIDTL